MRCTGTSHVDIELTIGRRSRAGKIHVAVVASLGLEVLVGLELISIFKLIIDGEARSLSFKKSSIKSGVRVSKSIVLEPRTQNIISAAVNTTGTILTLPLRQSDGVYDGVYSEFDI